MMASLPFTSSPLAVGMRFFNCSMAASTKVFANRLVRALFALPLRAISAAFSLVKRVFSPSRMMSSAFLMLFFRLCAKLVNMCFPSKHFSGINSISSRS